MPVLGSSFLVLVYMSIGFMLLFIPGIIVLLMFYVTVPVAVVERLGVSATLQRSRELTKGHRFRLLCIAVLIWLL